MSDLLPLADAARRLGVSVERARQLVVAGDLPGQRFGHAWAVPAGAVEARRHHGAVSGRPFGSGRAWQSIRAGEVDLSAPGRYRHRAVAHRYLAGPGDLSFLSGHPDVVVGGVAGANAHGELLSAADVGVDLYVDARLHRSILRQVAAIADPLGSLVIRVVPDDVWPSLVDGGPVAPSGAVALDLIASGDPRHWSAAEHLVGRRG